MSGRRAVRVRGRSTTVSDELERQCSLGTSNLLNSWLHTKWTFLGRYDDLFNWSFADQRSFPNGLIRKKITPPTGWVP